MSLLTNGLPITSIMFRILRIWSSPSKCNYLNNKKHFLSVLFHLWNLHQILNISIKKKILIANVFPKLKTALDLVRPFTKKHPVRTFFDGQLVKGSRTLVKSLWEHFYHIFPSLWGEMIWRISPSLKFGIIGLFINTWTAHYKYNVPDFENLKFPIQMQLS